MKKRATGLTSVPASSVPGSEDVEVNSLESEDIEAGNHGGFNQVDPSEFSVLMNIINKESANYNFHNIKVSNKMKEELIKLNKALNGLGYKNLIKMAQAADFGSPVNTANVTPNSYYLWQEKGLVIQPLNKFEAGSGLNDTEMRFKIKFASGKDQYFYDGIFNYNIVTDGSKIYEDNLDNDEEKKLVPINNINKYTSYEGVLNAYNIEKSRGPGKANSTAVATGTSATPARSIGRFEPYPFPWSSTYNRYDIFSNHNTAPAVTGTTSAPEAGDTPSTPGASTRSGSRITTKGWDQYLKKDSEKDRSRHQIRELWERFVKLKVGDSYDENYSSYQRWWIFTFQNKQREGHPAEVIAELRSLIGDTSDNAAATGIPAAATPQSTPTSQSTATSAASSVSETVNGKQSVSIGTFGGDQIYLILDSLNEGNPQLFRKDNRSGNVRQMGPNESIQFRNSLNNREIRRIERSLAMIPGYQDKARYFADFMKLQRKDNRWHPLRTKGRKEKMDQKMQGARGGMSQMSRTSARQSRLDSLKKKGII